MSFLSCGPASNQSQEEQVYYYVSSVTTGKSLVCDWNADVTYKPVYFKSDTNQGMTPLRFERNPWDSAWWLNLMTIDGKAQCLHIGEGSQLFMGDAESGKLEAIQLLFNPNSEKIFGMVNPSQFLVMGANEEAKISDHDDGKYAVAKAN